MNSEEIIDRGEKGVKKNYFVLSKVNAFTKEDHKLYLKLVEGEVVLEFITSDIVRVVMGKEDKLNLETSIAVLEPNRKYDDFMIEDKGEELELKTDSLIIRVNKERFALGFYNIDGTLIHQDYDNRALGWSGDEVRAWKEVKTEERFYGLGEKTGFLDKRGKEYTMWNTDTFDPHVPSTDPLYQAIPFLIGFEEESVYGIYFDNTYKTNFDLGKDGKEYYSFWAEGGKLDYYFINGEDIKNVVSKYTTLTGRMSLPPKWSLGYHQSRYSYYPEEEVRDLAQNFREKDIPCDVIHLDIHYMDEYRVFTWDKDRFPRPEKMLSDLDEDGFKVVTIVDPGVKKDPRYKLYQEGIKNDYFCKYLDGEYYTGEVWPGECVFPDFTKKEVRNWWGDLHQQLLDQGVTGIWNDMNEPAVFNDTSTMDLDVVHDNDGDPGTHRRFHNIYGMLEEQATYEGLKKHRPDERPFIVTRAGFSGIQRFAAVWTGDNRSFWQHLQMAMPMLMNLGLSGVTFSGTDVGGFAYDADGELLTRWTQLGTFMPFFRNHCALPNLNQEPWAFDEEHEKIIRKYIKLRYKFLTHIYNLFYQASQTGLPVMRPLVMEYPKDKKTYNLSDQFMVGDSILVAPICQPDADERLVYLPAGKWCDFWTGEYYDGNQSMIITAPLDKLPIFIKAGNIIPLAPVMNYVDEKKIEELEIIIYLDEEIKEDSYTLYEDDGLSFSYEDGEYNLRKFSYNYQDGELEFKIDKLHQQYQIEYDSYKLRFKNLKIEPVNVVVDNEEITRGQHNNGEFEINIPITASEIKIR